MRGLRSDRNRGGEVTPSSQGLPLAPRRERPSHTEPQRFSRQDRPGEELDWPRLLRTLWRRKFLIGVSVAVAMVLAGLYILQVPSRYEAQVLVMLTDRPTAFEDQVPGVPPAEDDIESEVQLLETRTMAEKLLKSFDLHTVPEFNTDLRPDSWLGILFDGIVPGIIARMRTEDQPPGADQDWSARYRKTINEVLNHIRAEQVGSNLIEVSFSSSDPGLAERGARKLASLYIDQRLQARRSVAEGEAEFLEREVAQYRQQVAEQTQKIQDYRKQNQLDRAEALEEEITNLSERRLDLQRDLRMAQAHGGNSGEPPTSDLLSALLTRQIETENEIDQLSDEYGANHPTMLDLQAERASTQRQINQERARLRARQQDEVNALSDQIASIEDSIQSLKGQLDQMADARVALEAMERDLAPDQLLLEQYLERLNEARSQTKADLPDVRVVSDAVRPDEPTYPRTSLILGVAFFGSLIGGGLIALGIESLDDTVRSSEHIEELVGLQTLVLVPEITDLDPVGDNPEDYAVEYPHSPFGEAIRSLRTALFVTGDWAAPKTVLMSSAVSGEGKTSMAMCLARVEAVAGRRTLLIDCDLRRPRIHQLVREQVGEGLSEILLRKRQLEEVLQTDPRSGAHLVTAGGRVDDPASLLASTSMHELLNQAARDYDLVVLDSPPLLSVSEGRILSGMADKSVFVVHWGKTRRNDVLLGARVLLDAGADIAGVVLSQVDVRKHAKYDFRDSGHYYDQRYTKYYTHS